MDIFNVFTLLGGLAFFLYGMTVLSNSLQKMAGGKLEKMLRKVTDNKWLGLIFGALITIAIQSSSAMTVMLVGFVNSGIMEVNQTISVIMGSDIGTTLTAWILSLTGVSSDNPFIKMLNPTYFSPVIALIGILLYYVSKREKKKNLGLMMIGFAILMTGMTMMSDSMSPLKDMPAFTDVLTAFSNPILGVLVGAVITGIVQSSAATVGILQALSLTGQVTFGMAIPIVMGENIGTCMTAILSAIGVSRKAKRVAAIHISIKIIGTVIVLAVFYLLNIFMRFSWLTAQINPVYIALVHTVFNFIIVAMMFPFQKQLEKLSTWIVRDSDEDRELFLDERLLVTPTVALAECNNAMMKMTELTEQSLDTAVRILREWNEEQRSFMDRNEERIDSYEDHIGTFLMKLNAAPEGLSEADSLRASKILHGINEFERVADHALNLAKSAEELQEKDVHFSGQALGEMNNLLDAIQNIYSHAIDCFRKDDAGEARKCEPLQGVIDVLCATLKESHVRRLQKGVCGPEQGFVFNDILTNCERISDHSMNIAASVLRNAETSDPSKMGYMHDLKSKTSPEYIRRYEEYYKRYFQNIKSEQ